MSRHIVIDARLYSSSTGRYVRKLIENLEYINKNNRYTILLNKKDFSLYVPKSNNFSKISVNYDNYLFVSHKKYKAMLTNLKPDLVHFTFPNQPLNYSKKSVVTIHDLTPLTRYPRNGFSKIISLPKHYAAKGFYYNQIKDALTNSSTVIAPSNFVKNQIKKLNINKNNIDVIYESADKINQKPSELTNLKNKIYILYVGRVQPHKNIYGLIKAFDLLKKSNPNLKLVITGKHGQEYKRLINALAPTTKANIVFTGFVDEQTLRWLYENAEAYVFPSLSEGFGLPGLEAMAHGCPVVSSNATCLPEVYGNGALYFDPTNVDDMANKIRRVLSDKKLRAELTKKGYAQVKKYSWEKMAKQTLNVYKSVLR
jgi:glycosyltransferase involved in cell wall biosynthesis